LLTVLLLAGFMFRLWHNLTLLWISLTSNSKDRLDLACW
jgi:hypothetical protein